jgi:diguanylate cyclase (GGDEF)-like protein
VDIFSVAWSPESQPLRSDAAFARETSIAAYAVLSATDGAEQRDMIALHLREFLDASVVRAYDLGPDGRASLAPGAGGAELPTVALEMEAELLPRALERDQSLISNHRGLDEELSELARRCRIEHVVTHILLARARGTSHGAFAVHHIDRDMPPYERRSPFYSYWSSVGLALAATHERERGERELAALSARLRTDPLTGLPNGTALDEQLRERINSSPMSVVAVDFDGLKEANDAFASYEEGGDVLIKAVATALREITAETEFVARLHTRGDEFAVVLPHADEAAATRRAREIEAALDALHVPPSHRSVYHGASVSAATRRENESPQRVLDRAVAAMHDRKAERKTLR